MAGLFWWINTLPELETTISENQKNKEIVIDQSDEFKPDTNKDFSNSLNLIEEENDSFLNINSDSVSQNEIIIENEDLILKFNSKGGLLVEAQLKKFTDYKGDPLYMVKDGNQNISLNFSTLNGKSVNTSNYNFNPIINKDSDATTLTMVLSVSEINL
jgi:YidC/Oxa1 family membrane protein insertase